MSSRTGSPAGPAGRGPDFLGTARLALYLVHRPGQPAGVEEGVSTPDSVSRPTWFTGRGRDSSQGCRLVFLGTLHVANDLKRWDGLRSSGRYPMHLKRSRERACGIT